jgi:EAL domain-containing protein (putative c-di-GMP-specific phosphodiesterase class I)
MSERQPRVLLVDDSVEVASALVRHLTRAGFAVCACADGRSALDQIGQGGVQVVITDISMPGMSGIELLRAIRRRDQDLPVVLMSGVPDVPSAVQAIDYGAFRYLTKPIDIDDLISTVRRAVQLHQLAAARREALATMGKLSGEETGLKETFQRVLDALWMAYQPIVHAKTGSLFGYEALLRSEDRSLPHPGAILDAAGRLGALPALGRAVRQRVALDLAGAAPAWRIFVNVHPGDLTDLEDIDQHAGLERNASRIVLEITERAALETITDLRSKVGALRDLGYTVAVDDLGAGYAGLSSFVHLEPDFVKLDMSLVRGAHESALKQKLVRSITTVCKDLGIIVVAEGIETVDERDALTDLGCDLLSGYYFGRPSRPFMEVQC